MRMLGIFAAALMLGACATAQSGRDFDTAKAAQIKVGETTKDQVQAMLGQPTNRNKVDARETWVYYQNTASSGTAGGAAKNIGLSVAEATVGTLVPGAGMVVGLAGLAVHNPMSNAMDTAISSKMLSVQFDKGVVAGCTLTVTKGRHASDSSGPMSDTETTHCGS